MKDPAFLFYSKDFYEGTRTMLPEERACYIDLMIYQHQNGPIPAKEIKRVLMYCNGIDEATLIATLTSKFTLCDGFYLNEKLSNVIDERKEFSNKQSTNGSVGNFWKKAKSILDSNSFLLLKSSLYKKTNIEIFELIKDKVIDKAMLDAMLYAMRTHLADEDAIKDVSIIKESNIIADFKFFYSIDEIEEYMLSNDNSRWFEYFCMNNKIPPDQLKICINEFVNFLRDGNCKEKHKKDLFEHFKNWMNKRNYGKQQQEKTNVYVA